MKKVSRKFFGDAKSCLLIRKIVLELYGTCMFHSCAHRGEGLSSSSRVPPGDIAAGPPAMAFTSDDKMEELQRWACRVGVGLWWGRWG
jgi:hypothetical protein